MDETQDDIARVILQLAAVDDTSPVTLSKEERAAISISREAATRGEFAADDEVAAVWRKHGL